MSRTRDDYEAPCRCCGAVVIGRKDGEFFDNRAARPCDWDNCTVHACPNCEIDLGRSSWGLAGRPDCPCDGTPVPRLRWPWTSKRFVTRYCRFHIWAFGIRCGGGSWRTLLFTPVPYLVFGNYTGAVYRHARLFKPEFFERKRVTE